MEFAYHVISIEVLDPLLFYSHVLTLVNCFLSPVRSNTNPLLSQISLNGYSIKSHLKFAIAFLKNFINFLARGHFYLQPLERVERKFCLFFSSSMPTEGKLLRNPGSINYNESSHNDQSVGTNYYLLAYLYKCMSLNEVRRGDN